MLQDERILEPGKLSVCVLSKCSRSSVNLFRSGIAFHVETSHVCFFVWNPTLAWNESGNKEIKYEEFQELHTTWKVSNYGVISGPYFPVFGLNTGKYWPEITPYLDTFLAVGAPLSNTGNFLWGIHVNKKKNRAASHTRKLLVLI